MTITLSNPFVKEIYDDQTIYWIRIGPIRIYIIHTNG